MSLAITNLEVELGGYQLRSYQDRMVRAWQSALDRGVRRGLIVAATGTGKTTVFSAIIQSMLADNPSLKVLVLAHRQELLDQAAERISAMCEGMEVAVHSGVRKAHEGAQVIVGSVQSLGNRRNKAIEWFEPDLVIVDEAHHAAARTYQNVFRRFKCFDKEGAFLLGVTATPHRMDNMALHGTNGAIFEELVFKYDIVQAIQDGFLVDLRGYRAVADYDLSRVKTVRGDYQQNQLQRELNTEAVNRLAFESWSQVAESRPTIVFCSGVEHAKSMADLFNMEGVTAEAIYGEMKRDDREQVLRDFRAGKIQVLTNMDVLTEGFDAQHCSAIVLLRPTQSWSLFAQMVGRGLRCLPGIIEGVMDAKERRKRLKASGKPECIVIDIVGSSSMRENLKPAEEIDKPSLSGLVDLPPDLELEGRTILQAVEEFAEMPNFMKAAAFRRTMTFSGLTGVLTEVAMIAELDIPDEARGQDTRLYWLKVKEGEYVLDIGGRGVDQHGRLCGLTCDMIGNWTLTISSKHRDPEEYFMGREMEGVFERAERKVRDVFFGVTRLASREAAWRKGRPTEMQLEYLKEKGIGNDVLDALDQGHASALITMMERSSSALKN